MAEHRGPSRWFPFLAAVGAVLSLLVAPARATVPSALLVEVERAGGLCHALERGEVHAASLTVRVSMGRTVQLESHDMYPFDLVQLAGPAPVRLPPYAFDASTSRSLQFAKAGTYRILLRPQQFEGPKPCTYEDGRKVALLTVVVS